MTYFFLGAQKITLKTSNKNTEVYIQMPAFLWNSLNVKTGLIQKTQKPWAHVQNQQGSLGWAPLLIPPLFKGLIQVLSASPGIESDFSLSQLHEVFQKQSREQGRDRGCPVPGQSGLQDPVSNKQTTKPTKKWLWSWAKLSKEQLFVLLLWSLVCSAFIFSTECLPEMGHADNDLALYTGQFSGC